MKEIKQIKEVNKFNNYNNDYNNDKKSYDEEDYNYEEEEEEKTTNDDKNVNKKRNKNDKNITTIKKNNKDIFNREKSRFDFCVNNKNNKENNNIVVPEHILNLINKKINSFVLTKYMQQKLIDKIFLNESIKNDNKGQNDEWTKFIYDNIDMTNKNDINNNKDELTEDLEHINDFILKKSLKKSDNN